jgi:ectoine hydroxylase-related dioxygenase (phytanoyl-CoA dioxygenase family)
MIDIEQFEREGFAMTPSLLSSDEIKRLISVIEKHASSEQKRGSIRDIMDRAPELHAVADNINVHEIVEQILGPNAFVVRTTLFDKTGDANWKVPWHQDVTIAVQERHDTEGYGPWSNKEGVVHVQPPAQVLEKMVTVRVHLDDCPASNGALRVMPGTHTLGRLNQNFVEEHVDESNAVYCEARRGEALVMRPLLLHASSVAVLPNHRRVLHFDYAIGSLTEGLEWRSR